MKYLLVFLLLALQGSVFGYSTNNQYKNDAQKALISVKCDLNARSFYNWLNTYLQEVNTLNLQL